MGGLERLDGAPRVRSEPSVDLAGVESELGEDLLHLGDRLAARALRQRPAGNGDGAAGTTGQAAAFVRP